MSVCGRLWIKFNIAVFSGYAIFSAVSFFWPQVIRNLFLIPLHIATLIIYAMVVYGLIRIRHRINYLIVLISPLMIIHLIVFITTPIGLEFAFIGPSRAFYMMLFYIASITAGEGSIFPVFIAFNLIMIVINLINFCFFIRKKVAVMFEGGTTDNSNAG